MAALVASIITHTYVGLQFIEGTHVNVCLSRFPNGDTKEAFGSDAVAGSVGDADATHTAGTTVVEAPKSLKQIFSKGPNFAAIEQSGQDQGRVHLPLDFFREVHPGIRKSRIS